jgi:hypothetical protein
MCLFSTSDLAEEDEARCVEGSGPGQAWSRALACCLHGGMMERRVSTRVHRRVAACRGRVRIRETTSADRCGAETVSRIRFVPVSTPVDARGELARRRRRVPPALRLIRAYMQSGARSASLRTPTLTFDTSPLYTPNVEHPSHDFDGQFMRLSALVRKIRFSNDVQIDCRHWHLARQASLRSYFLAPKQTRHRLVTVRSAYPDCSGGFCPDVSSHTPYLTP